MGLLDYLRPRCPKCNARGLRLAQFIRATVLVDGQRAPAAWSYYRCPTCTARFRRDVRGSMIEADDSDWRMNVDGRE
jgi:hypothetical protein